MTDIYYHGTMARPAIDALLASEPLRPLRPAGRSDFPGSRDELVHVTPSFYLAADYAFLRSRDDWPEDHDVEMAKVGYVFGFEAFEDPDAVMDEDELGWAMMRAMTDESAHNMNSEFADAYLANAEVMARVAEEAAEFSDEWSKGTFVTRKKISARVGLAFRRKVSDRLQGDLVDLGISVATRMELRPIAAWTVPKLVFDVAEAVPVADFGTAAPRR